MQQQLRLFPTTTISVLRGSSSSSSSSSSLSFHRVSSLGFCLLEKMNNRAAKSSSSASASNSSNQCRYVRVDRHVTNGSPTLGQTSSSKETAHRAEQQTQLFSRSNPAYEAEWPLPSDNLGSGSKAKRRIRTDLGPLFGKTPHEGAGKQVYLPKLEASFGSNTAKPYQPNVSAMPTRTLKKPSSFPSGSTYLPPNSPEPGVGVRSSGDSECMNVNEPFDICFSGSRMPADYKPYLQEKDSLQGIETDYRLESGKVLRPGMVLLRSYIPLSQQVDIVMRCRELGLGSGGFYQPGYQDGAKLRLHMMCLGLDWDPQTKKYGKMRPYDNAEAPDIPYSFDYLVRRALHDSQILIKQQLKRSDVKEILPGMSPDICIVNFYTTKGRLGLHQDRDESRESLLKGLPVVSISIGDSAEFLYGDQRDVDKAERILLESGDVLIFGGKSRHIFHGVTSINPKTAPPALLDYTKLRPGRLNLTFRKN